MRYALLFGSMALATSSAVACDDMSPPHSPFSPGGSTATSGGSGTGSFTGLPCDVQKVLEDGCIGCHSGSQAPPLRSYEELTAPAPGYPGQTVAQRSLARMKNTASPMPPLPAVPAAPDEIAIFEAWVNGNTPKGTECTGAAGTDARPNPYNTPSVCTSGKAWRGDNSASMDPGKACLDCHQKQGGPRFAVSGTVYPTAHEPDECYGAAGGLTVVITDKNGTVTNLQVGPTGNFSSSGRNIVAPFTAKVTDGKGTRVMVAPITAGDCNSCHTEKGINGAPGRVMAP